MQVKNAGHTIETFFCYCERKKIPLASSTLKLNHLLGFILALFTHQRSVRHATSPTSCCNDETGEAVSNFIRPTTSKLI